jgi:hypothetical protein
MSRVCVCVVCRFADIGLPGEWYGTLEWQDPADRQRKKTINVLKVMLCVENQVECMVDSTLFEPEMTNKQQMVARDEAYTVGVGALLYASPVAACVRHVLLVSLFSSAPA